MSKTWPKPKGVEIPKGFRHPIATAESVQREVDRLEATIAQLVEALKGLIADCEKDYTFRDLFQRTRQAREALKQAGEETS